jgi:signal transduction histidine kinase
MGARSKRTDRPVERASMAADAFFDKSAIMMAVADADGVITAANPSLSRFLGFRPGALVGRRLDDIIPAEMAEAIETGRGPSFGSPRNVFQLTSKTLGPRWVDADFERRGEVLLIAMVDIHESWTRLSAIEEARRSRDALLNDSAIGTWRYDPDAEVYFFSPELLEGMVALPTGVPRAYVDSLCHPDDLEVERPIRERITTEGGSGEMELRIRNTPDGRWRYNRVLLRSGRRMPSGKFEMYGLTQAITDLAIARDEANANAERLGLALSAAKGGMYEINFETHSIYGSPELAALIGRDVTYDDVAESFWSVLHPDNYDAVTQMIGRWGEPGYESVDIRGSDGRWLRMYCDVVRGADGIARRGVGFLLDVDEHKRQELDLIEAQRAAQEASVAKSAFLASVSHEIRTPMNGIVGVLHLLGKEPISQDGRRLLDEALACSGMLSQLIDDVLDFSKIEAGKLELSPEPVSVVEALEGVAGLLRPQAKNRGLYLRTRIEPEVDWVEIDPVRLRQCLFNLIGNAVKFTLEGGVEVRVSRPAEGRLRVEIEDTGVGIPEAAKPRMFDRFEQADRATTRNFSGTGLGLAITRSLAHMMGGDIGFESEEEKGSTFWIDVDAPVAEPKAAHRAQEDEGLVLDGIRVLVVDDNATNRLVGSKIIESLGATAMTCEDGESAVFAVANEDFDVVLMDVNMPGIDGVEATRRIRALGGRAAATPILALTANVMAHQRQSYLASGMDGVVAKPFSPATLLSAVMQAISPARAAMTGT